MKYETVESAVVAISENFAPGRMKMFLSFVDQNGISGVSWERHDREKLTLTVSATHLAKLNETAFLRQHYYTNTKRMILGRDAEPFRSRQRW